jgi:alanine racemase
MRHSSQLEISLPLLAENIKVIEGLAGKAQILPMVKANAYGHGLLPITKFLAHELKIKQIGVASLGEAISIMKDEPSLPSRLYVFSDTEIHHSEYSDFYLNHDVLPVLHQMSDVERVVKDEKFKRLPLVIKLNTGMNRLGIEKSEWESLVQLLKAHGRFEIEHLLTHFACADMRLKEGDRTHRQYEMFKEAKEFFAVSGIAVKTTSVANSGAITQQFGIEESFVRPGIMMYGGSEKGGHVISKLQSKIIKVFPVKKGTPVGYGNHVAGDDGIVAILPLGYGDGVLTYASGTRLTVKGAPCQLFARVNMDLTFLFFRTSDFPNLKVGEAVDLWNNDPKVIVDIADQMKTISYQLFCAVSSRVPRTYSVI